jgi:iron complex outermembrane recepter protein
VAFKASLLARFYAGVATLAALVSLQPLQAQAQSTVPQAANAENEADTEIVVTGSRIPRANFETAQPISVLSSEQIEQRGYTNIGDALSEIPAFGVPGANRVGDQAGSFGSGQVFINFFGLGDQRTLTVVNGRRFVSSNTASIFGPTGAGSQVDFSIIPTLIIERVETVAVGGAPIYGSDAIAGTVNLITKRNFDGILLDAQYGLTTRGDAADFRVRGLLGHRFASGRGNITIGLEYNKAEGLVDEARPNARLRSFFTTPLGNSPFDNTYISDRRIPALSEFGVPLVTDFFPLSPGQATDFGFQPSVTDASGNALVFDASGNLVPLDFGQQTGNLVNFDGGNGFALPNNLLTPTRRILATALGQFDLTDKIRLFGEAWYANSKGTELRDQPVYNTAFFDSAGNPDGNLILSVNNPYLSAAARQTIISSLASNPAADAPDIFYLGRANTDLVTGRGSSQVELYRFVGGIDGKFNALGRDWTFEIVGNYGRSKTKGRSAELVQQNFANALNAVSGPNGPVCAAGAVNATIPTLSAACAPINPFGQQISQAARDYVTTIADPSSINTQWVATASVAGSIFDVWGGPVGIAVGYEHRRESAKFDPGAFFAGAVDVANPTGPRRQYGRSSIIDPVAGSFSTNEVFGELTIPLISEGQNIPLIYSLELHGAGRYIDNSLAGGDPTYTGDIKWQPVKDITFRGNYTRSVRAPAITELFNPNSQIFATADDPCDSRFIGSGPNPARRQANCQADGLPANFQSNIVDFTSRGSLSGNAGLKNEISNAWTIGTIIQPRFIPRFSLTVDWVNIKVQGAIESLDAVQTLEGCYDAPTFPTDICNQIDRDANGQVTFIRTGFANAASRKYQGLISDLDYTIPTPFLGAGSSLNLGVKYQYINRLEVRVGQGDITTLRNSIGYSKHQATINLNYRKDGLTWQVQAQHYGKTSIDPDSPPNTYEFQTVGAVTYFNTSLNYKVNDQFSMRAVLDNVFDKGAPFPVPANGGRLTYADGIIGRAFKIGASVKF